MRHSSFSWFKPLVIALMPIHFINPPMAHVQYHSANDQNPA